MFTLSLDSASSNLSTMGGKGHNLSILCRDGSISVPPGFVVTISAYHEFINQDDKELLKEIEAGLIPLQKQEEGSSTSTSATAELEAISTTIRTAFRKRQLPPNLQSDITERLASIFPDESTNLAIRSSATCEDMPGSSFAGQRYLSQCFSDA